MKNKYHSFFSGVVIFLICLFILVNLHSYKQMTFEWHQYTRNIDVAIEDRIGSLFVDMNNFPGGADKDLLFLSKLPETNQSLMLHQERKNYSIQASTLEHLYTAFADYKISYLGFTLVDKDGNELMQVNCKEEACENASSSKDWNQESIFRDGQNISKGTVTGSEILKESNSKGETLSYMYYTTPIRDDKGNFLGELIATVDAGYFLDDIASFSRPGESIFLINKDGQYLVGDASSTFQKDFPVAASTIFSRDEDSFQVEGELFTYRRIYFTPEGFIGAHSDLPGHYWILVDVTTENQAYPNLNRLEQRGWELLGLFDFLILAAIMAIICTWYGISKKR